MLIFIYGFIFVKTFLLAILIYSEHRKELLRKFLKNFDGSVIFVGEAGSHCVRNTVKDFDETAQMFTC